MPTNEKWRKRQIKQVVIVIVLLCGLAGVVYGYAQYRDTAGLLPVSFALEDGSSSETFYLEIANTPAQRKKGLMYRHSLGADRGMLFIFPKETTQSFWMKNTFIPLDMIFVASDFSVVGVVESAEPRTETKRSVPGVSQYVVELNGGTAAKIGVKKGATLQLNGEIPKPF
jgi:uncharacterized membrane protein (UPF0127 family)